jgi:hypothetical protein
MSPEPRPAPTFFSMSLGMAHAQSNFDGYTYAPLRVFEYCPGSPLPNGQCLALNTQWSSRKHQWINFFYRINDTTGEIKILYRLYNRTLDGDTVCFVAEWLDSNGSPLFVFHQRQGIKAKPNLHSKNPRIRESTFEFNVPPKVWANVTLVKMGYKECNKRDDKKIAKIINNTAIGLCSAITGDLNSCKKAGDQIDKAIESGDPLDLVHNR